MGQEADSSVYDEMHATAEAYNVPVEQSFYYPMFKRVAEEVRARGIRSVLEVGCGSGGLAEMLLRHQPSDYRGFDFSSVAVANAGSRTGQPERFFVGDALSPASYATPYDGIVCTEVLEHVERDRDIVRLWKAGAPCVCSVPNFDYPTHVRWFRREQEVLDRYSDLIDIDLVVRVAKNPRTGKTAADYVRSLKWARNRPRKLLGLLGVNSFDWYAGWFVFAGTCRNNG